MNLMGMNESSAQIQMMMRLAVGVRFQIKR